MVKFYRYKIATSHPKWPTREGIIVETEKGFGEIAPLPGFSKETLDDAIAELRSGKEPTLPSIRFGLACANHPLISIRTPIATLTPRTDFKIVKLKVGQLSVEDAIEYVKLHRNHRLRVDVNHQWTLEQALQFTKAFTPDDFDYLEEPTRTFEELIAFSQKTGFPIALDESIHSDWSAIPSLKAIVVKPTVVGHIPKVPSKIKLILSSSYESEIGLLHIARIAKELNLQDPIGIDTHTVFHDQLLTSPIYYEKGHFCWDASPISKAKLCPLVL